MLIQIIFHFRIGFIYFAVSLYVWALVPTQLTSFMALKISTLFCTFYMWILYALFDSNALEPRNKSPWVLTSLCLSAECFAYFRGLITICWHYEHQELMYKLTAVMVWAFKTMATVILC
jgi:hypothetical protein